MLAVSEGFSLFELMTIYLEKLKLIWRWDGRYAVGPELRWKVGEDICGEGDMLICLSIRRGDIENAQRNVCIKCIKGRSAYLVSALLDSKLKRRATCCRPCLFRLHVIVPQLDCGR